MDVDVSSVPGYLYWWALRRAKAGGRAATGVVDTALEAAAARLAAVVRQRLGAHDALEGVEEEAAVAAAADTEGAEPAELSDDTRGALVYAVKRATSKDPDFAARLADALAAVEQAGPGDPAGGGVSSLGGGTTAGRDVSVSAGGAGAVAVGGNAGDISLGQPAATPPADAGQAPGPSAPGPQAS
ncbi:hypothetical protein [Streptomyces lonarensis]|uniref:Uncharacterized protein n=1 Tax=Streptomyces lonarensis TaxID=700599 RepID=A0A7X6D356_9ACTN|nr:hypothetical protein [Streptomyces lonarensis]NJQ07341.1 hypothetical protein [Streptomyces lonarensis]